jgi:hypothetical protein
MCFLKTLIAEYFRLLGTEFVCDMGVLPVNGLVSPGEVANEFINIRSEGVASGFVDKAAVQYGGKLSRIKPCRVIHFKMDSAALKAVADRKSATVTAYILSLVFAAGKKATDELEGDFNIQVPVNMRKFYPSETLRNFSMYCGIRMPLAEIAGQIDSMDFVLGASITNRTGCAMVTFGNTTTLSVSKNTADPSFEEALYELLCRDGLTPVVEGSELIAD